MPIYVYECSNGHHYEIVEPMSAGTWHSCKECHPHWMSYEWHPDDILDWGDEPSYAHRIPAIFNANVGAVITPDDLKWEPRKKDYLGHRRWRAKEDARIEARKAAVNPVTSYRTGPGHDS